MTYDELTEALPASELLQKEGKPCNLVYKCRKSTFINKRGSICHKIEFVPQKKLSGKNSYTDISEELLIDFEQSGDLEGILPDLDSIEDGDLFDLNVSFCKDHGEYNESHVDVFCLIKREGHNG